MSESQRIAVSSLSVTGALDVLEEAGSDTIMMGPPTHDPDRPKPGTVVDERYEIIGALGEGGMGYVLAARHVILGTRLALKVLRREMTRDAEMVERFRREARAASAIGHPNIVEVRDFGTLPSPDGSLPGASYFVMEHLDGQGLQDALDMDGPFSVERAIDVIRQMGDALEAAHAHGIVHRDVKPENVILTVRNGRPDHVKILDFGIAKLDSAARISGAFRVLGTPAYMSPEQVQSRHLDQRSDVYSLGIVLYELLTATLPFEHAHPMEVLSMQVNVPPPSVLLLRPDVPDVIAETIARALEKEPSKRPETMRAMMDMLASVAVSRSAEFKRGAAPISTAPAAMAPLAARSSAPATRLSLPAAFAPASVTPLPVPVPAASAPVRSRSLRAVWAVAAVAVVLVGAVAAIGAAMEVHALLSPARVSPAPSIARTEADLRASVAHAPIPVPTVVAPVPLVGSAPPVPAIAPVPSHGALAHPHGPHAPGVPAATEPAPVVAPQAVEPIARPDGRPTAQVIDPWD